MLFSLCGSAGAMAVGFGELRGQPVLGERLTLGIELLGADKPLPEAACFRIVPPAGGGDLPWLKKATFTVRPGAPAIVNLRSDELLREPIIQVAVELGCGYDISRLYLLLASPPAEPPAVAAPQSLGGRRPSAAEALSSAVPPPPRALPRKAVLPRPPVALQDRLMLSGGGGVGELSLRLATEFVVRGEPLREAQRDILRLEFRMLMVMSEQAVTQLAAAEKLRNMEILLEELRRQAAVFAENVESGGEGGLAGGKPVPSSPPTAAVTPKVAASLLPGWITDWSLYGVLLGALLGVGAWLGWRNYRESLRRHDDSRLVLDEAPAGAGESAPMPVPDAAGDFAPPLEAIDHPPAPVDFELGAGGDGVAGLTVAEAVPAVAAAFDQPLPVAHIEINPVMELAEIMLSFGRVKGAAQTLQEYIDNNPQDALEPWIRLMDVYRMAGMREEFEKVTRNLNRHFNVEVQTWDEAQAEAASAAEARPQSLEDMPRLMAKVVELWSRGDVVGYLYQLLRDNRGGERVGFAMPVVDDILFLIELKETANRME